MTQITKSIAAVNPIDRFDMYRLPHKGIRAVMSHVLCELGALDASDAAEVERALADVSTLVAMCRTHLNNENSFIHPAMEARRPGSTAHVAKEHVDHERALERLETLSRAVERADDGGRARACHRLYAEMGYFVAENLEHMLREETENNAVLWACYSDEELREIDHALVAAIPPEKVMQFLRWMAPALSPGERAGLLGGIRAGAPPQVFAAIFASVEAHLSPRQLEKLTAALEVPSAA